MRVFKILTIATFAGVLFSMGFLLTFSGICTLLFVLSAIGYAITKKKQEYYKNIDYTKELNTPKLCLKAFIKDYNCLLLLIILFILYAFGVLYSVDKDAALLSLERKLSLLTFPLAFILLGKSFINKKILIIWAISFILGCCTISIYHMYVLFSASIKTSDYENLLTFLNQTFIHKPALIEMFPNKLIHSAYESQLMILSIYTIILTWIKHPIIFKKVYIKIIAISALIILFSTILVSTSKSGQAIFLLSIGVTTIYLLYLKYYKTVITIVFVSALAALSIIHFVPSTYLHIEQSLTTGINFLKGNSNIADGSIVQRFYLWNASIEAFSEKPILGYGSGDANTAVIDHFDITLKDEYSKLDWNPHNQFLQLLLNLGILGLSCFLTTYIIAIKLSFRKKDIIFLFFLSICAWFMIFESMLQQQTGIMPFCALFSVLFCRNKQVLSTSKEDNS